MKGISWNENPLHMWLTHIICWYCNYSFICFVMHMYIRIVLNGCTTSKESNRGRVCLLTCFILPLKRLTYCIIRCSSILHFWGLLLKQWAKDNQIWHKAIMGNNNDHILSREILQNNENTLTTFKNSSLENHWAIFKKICWKLLKRCVRGWQ